MRLAIAQAMAEQGHDDDAQREIALALMEATAGEALPPSGGQYIEAADIFRSIHDYRLSQDYIQHAKAAGAPDTQVRIGLANNYLALGETTKANAELAAIKVEADSAPDYQYLLAQANLYRQEHHNVQALTSFAQASNAEGEDQTATTNLLEAGANEGLRLNPMLSVLSEFSMQPIFEDTTVYVLDSKLDAPFAVPSSDVRFFRRRVLRCKLNRRMRSTPCWKSSYAGRVLSGPQHAGSNLRTCHKLHREQGYHRLHAEYWVEPNGKSRPQCHHFQRRRPDDNTARLPGAGPIESESFSHVHLYEYELISQRHLRQRLSHSRERPFYGD